MVDKKLKKKEGRPTKYHPQLCEVVKNLALAGYTHEDIAKTLGISEFTLYEWKKNYINFSKALEFKNLGISRVVGALFEAAVGYSHKDIIHASHKGKIITKDVVRRYPPNVKAIEILLRNCARKYFMDNPNVVPPSITLNITPAIPSVDTIRVEDNTEEVESDTKQLEANTEETESEDS